MDYLTYLASQEWNERRQRVMNYYGHRCAICNASGPLEVHHRTYERLGEEDATDIIPLCPECHERNTTHLPAWYPWLGRVDSKIFDFI